MMARPSAAHTWGFLETKRTAIITDNCGVNATYKTNQDKDDPSMARR